MEDYKPGDIIPPEDIVEHVFVKNRKVLTHMGMTGSGKSTLLHYLGTGTPLPVNSTISQTSKVEAWIDANGDVRIDTPGLRDNRQGLSNHTHLVNYLKFLERGQIELMSGIFLHVGTDTRDFDDVKQLGEFILGLVPNPVDYVVIIVNGSGGRNAVIDRLQQDGKDPIMLEAHLLRESQADYLLDEDGNEVADRFLVLGQGREQHNCDRLRDLGLPVEPFKASCNALNRSR